MNRFKCLMTHSTCYVSQVGIDHKHTGIVVHDTAAGNPNISRYVQPYEGDKNYDKLIDKLGKNKYGNDWNHTNSLYKGVHAFIGKLADGSVATCEVLEPGMDAWGVGKGTKVPAGTTYYKDERFKMKAGKLTEDTDGSDSYTYSWTEYKDGEAIKKSHTVAKVVINNATYYVNGDNRCSYNFLPTSYFQFEICDDYDDVKKPKAGATEEYFLACMKEAQEYCKYLIQVYKLNHKNVVSHHESYRLGYGCDHGDCDGWMSLYGYNMDWFRNEVKKLIDKTPYAAFCRGNFMGSFTKLSDATMDILGTDEVWVEDELVWSKPVTGTNDPVVGDAPVDGDSGDEGTGVHPGTTVGSEEPPHDEEQSGSTNGGGLTDDEKEEAMGLFAKIFAALKRLFELIFKKKPDIEE